jgi:putative transposase
VQTYQFITLHSTEFPVLHLCQTLEVSRSSYYEWQEGKTYLLKEKKAQVGHKVKAVFEENKQRYGSRRIEAELKDCGIRAGRHQVRKRMKEQGLKAIQPRSFVPKTTQTNPNLRRSPNLLLKMDEVNQINKVWVGDITYLPMADGSWSYLATWMDLCSRLIVGWKISTSLDASLVIQSFEKALLRRQPKPGLIIHSDGGGQYMDKDFRAMLAEHKCRQSMTRVDNHYDNAFAESLFSRLKAELLRNTSFNNLQDAQSKIFEYIEAYYNRKRRHSSLNYKSPEDFEYHMGNKSQLTTEPTLI